MYNTCGCLAYDLNGELSLDYIEDNCLIYKYNYYSMNTKRECFNDTGKSEIMENLGESRNIRKKLEHIIYHGVTWIGSDIKNLRFQRKIHQQVDKYSNSVEATRFSRLPK